MKKSLLALAVPFLLLTVPALGCDYPARIGVPDGSTASEGEMIAGQQTVKGYMATMEEYLECIDKESGDVDGKDDAAKEQRAILISKHNAAVDEMELVADSFNQEIGAYKQANK
jgi:hypothetical protein